MTIPVGSRQALLSSHSIDALVAKAFPFGTRSDASAAYGSRENDERTTVRPNLSPNLSALPLLSSPLRVKKYRPLLSLELARARAAGVRAAVKKSARRRRWIPGLGITVAVGVLGGSMFAIFLYGDEVAEVPVMTEHTDRATPVEAPTVEATPKAESLPPPAAPISGALPVPLADKSVAVEAAAVAVSKSLPSATGKPTAAKPAPIVATKPAQVAAVKPAQVAAVKPAASKPVVENSKRAAAAEERDDSVFRKERALAEAARKLADRQLSRSLSR